MYCLITGASYGIGKSLVEEMIKRGYKVIGIARSIDKMKEMKKHLGADFYPIQCDLRKIDDIKKISKGLLKKGIIPKLFIFNAVLFRKEKGLYEHKEFFEVNYLSAMAFIDNWIKTLEKTGGGRFIAIGSLNKFTFPSFMGHAASKAALERAFDGLRLTYLNTNIDFVILDPGAVKTKNLDTARTYISKYAPLAVSAEHAAKQIADHVWTKKAHVNFSWFHTILTNFLNYLPKRLLHKLYAKQ